MNVIARTLAISMLLSVAACTAIPTTRDSAYSVRANYALGGLGRWDLLAVDSARHHVFLSRSDRVDVIDANSGKLIGSIAGTDGVHGIAVAEKLGRGYASNGQSNSLTEFDLASLQRLRDIPLSGQSPDAIVYDAFSNRVFSFNAKSNNVSIVDPVAGTEVAVLAFEGNPELAVVDGHGHLFVNIEDKAQLVEIDTAAAKIVQTWSLPGCEEPSGLAMDVAHARLFSVCQNQHMVVTDASNGRQVTQLDIGEGPDGAAFEPSSQNVFSPNGRSGTLTVIHEDDPEHFHIVQTLATQIGARTLALDPDSHRLYLPTARFGPAPADPNQRRPILPDSFSVVVVSP